MPTREQRIQALVRAGVMPSTAERVVDESDDAEQRLPTLAEIAADAEITDADKERARTWVLYSPDIPARMRRMWTAKVKRA